MSPILSVRDHIRQKGIIPKPVKKVLHIATRIYDKVPRKGDSTWQVALKLMSIADSIESEFQKKRTELSVVVERLGLETTTNSVFTSMFFATKLQDEFEIERYSLDGMGVVEATSPTLGKLLFIERWEKVYNATFYHSSDFDFKKILERTWELYDNRLQFEINYAKSTYTSFSNVPNPLYGIDTFRMDKVVQRHQKYQNEGISRAYMFYGAPGTGKTSFALEFANRVGKRVLRIDARSFAVIGSSEITFIMDALRPDFIMVDDVDKADVNHSLPAILSILTELKMRKTHTSLLLTANNVGSFDHGFLRPGRIDTWMTFDTPDEFTRREILIGYLGTAGVRLSQKSIDNFVRITADLTQDYLREIAQRLKYEDEEEVIDVIMSMRKLLRKPDLNTAPTTVVNGTATNGAATNGVAKHS